MSITTLKRKSAAKYGRHSTKNGFSLNNSRRIDAHSNQEQTQHLFVGSTPKVMVDIMVNINTHQSISYTHL